MDVQWSVVDPTESVLCGVGQPRLLTTVETARYLGVSRNTVDRLRSRREISYYRIGGSIRYSQWDLRELVSGRRIDPLQVIGKLNQVLTKRELAEFLTVSTRTIELLVKRHGFWRRRIGSSVRFARQDVLEQLTSTYRVPATVAAVSTRHVYAKG